MNARARLFCLPPAGAGASTFYPLLALDSNEVEICPITLPGREDRYRDAIPDTLAALADQTADQLTPWLDRPYLVLGYSMGALLGWEMVQRWRQRGIGAPRLFGVLSAPAPRAPGPDTDTLHRLPSEEFRAAIAELGGIPAELQANAEVMDLYEPIVRADLRNCETHRPSSTPPIDADLHGFLGNRDTLVTSEQVEGWRRHTTGEFVLHRLDEPHIFSREGLLGVGRTLLAGYSARSR